jgi:excisionase family DNA binding protein
MPPDKDGIGSRAASADPVDVASQLNQLEQAISAMRAQLSQIMVFVEQQPKKQLTVNEAAKLAGRKPYTIRRWIKEGGLKATRINLGGPKGRLLIDSSDLFATSFLPPSKPMS